MASKIIAEIGSKVLPGLASAEQAASMGILGGGLVGTLIDELIGSE